MPATIAPLRAPVTINSEEMAMVDLNVDPGEGETPISPDLAIVNCATSVNPSFGLHAGNQRVIRDSAIAATGSLQSMHGQYRRSSSHQC
jgi:hypothetical protein